MRRVLALWLSLLLGLQGAWAGTGAPMACGCVAATSAAAAVASATAAAAPANARADRPCPSHGDAAPAAAHPDDAAGDPGHADTDGAPCTDAGPCGDAGCAGCHATQSTPLLVRLASFDADPARPAPDRVEPRAPSDHVPAVPLRPPRASRR